MFSDTSTTVSLLARLLRWAYCVRTRPGVATLPCAGVVRIATNRSIVGGEPISAAYPDRLPHEYALWGETLADVMANINVKRECLRQPCRVYPPGFRLPTGGQTYLVGSF